MIEIETIEISQLDWSYIHSQAISSLYSYESLSIYENLDLLTIFKDHQPIAIWPIPFTWKENQKIAFRPIRLLPYHPPLIFKNHAQEKRSILWAFIQYLQKNYYAIDLPLAPRYHDVAVFSHAGMYVEWRNTHLFSPFHSLKDNIHPKAKNHINSAKKELTIKGCQNAEEFDFDQGIVTDDDSHRRERKKLACELSRKGSCIVFSAYAGTSLVGQNLVLFDQTAAYLFHSWYKKDSIRGIPSLLISEAMDFAFTQPNIQFFDLEGSIIPNVDRFFASLGGLQTPYAYIQWCKDKQKMLSMIESCIFLPLRLNV